MRPCSELHTVGRQVTVRRLVAAEAVAWIDAGSNKINVSQRCGRKWKRRTQPAVYACDVILLTSHYDWSPTAGTRSAVAIATAASAASVKQQHRRESLSAQRHGGRMTSSSVFVFVPPTVVVRASQWRQQNTCEHQMENLRKYITQFE